MYEKLTEALIVMIVGIGGVFLSLLFFYLLMIVLNVVDSKVNKYRVNKKLSPKTKLDNIEPKIQITPEIVAVISAAAYEVFKKPVVVKKIKYLTKSATTWSETGRMIVMGSHNINKTK
ncbi:MAG: OadG family transporter subunit [bacterium]